MGQQLSPACCSCNGTAAGELDVVGKAGESGSPASVTSFPWFNPEAADVRQVLNGEPLRPNEPASPCKSCADEERVTGDTQPGTASPDESTRPSSPAEARSPAGDAAQDGGSLGATAAAEGDAIVDATLAQTELLMKDYDVVEAEALLARTLDKLDGLGFVEAADRLRGSQLFKRVLELVAQYDATVEMMYNDKFQTLYENEAGRFELYQEPSSFEYRMTVNLEAPLAECMSVGHELDLVPKAQPMVSGEPLRIGPNNGFFIAWLAKMPVLCMQAELLMEALRIRDHRSGFLLESIRSSFPADGRHIPQKSWRAVRPWIYTANLWVPRGGGEKGTCLVQVTRVDNSMGIPQWILNFVFRQIASTFMSDLVRSTQMALQCSSPWAARISKDEVGLYSELRKVEEASSKRDQVVKLPEREFFDREWRLRPEPVDTRPPSTR